MNRDVAVLREAIKKVTQILAGEGIRVEQRGVQAFVRYNKKSGKPELVVLPELPDTASEELILALQGFLDHEVSHILHTDVEWLKKGIERGRTFAKMHNIIEDTYIERAMAQRFKGTSYNLDRLHEFFLSHFTEPELNKALMMGGDENRIFSVLVVVMFRAWSGQEQFKRYMDDGRWPLVERFVDKLGADIIRDVANCGSTEDTYYLTERVLDALTDPDAEEEGDGDGEGDGKGKSDKKGDKKGKSKKSKSGADEDDSDMRKSSRSESSGDEKDEKDDRKSDSSSGGGKDDEKESDSDAGGSDDSDESDDKDDGKGDDSDDGGAGDDESDKSEGDDGPDDEKDDPEGDDGDEEKSEDGDKDADDEKDDKDDADDEKDDGDDDDGDDDAENSEEDDGEDEEDDREGPSDVPEVDEEEKRRREEEERDRLIGELDDMMDASADFDEKAGEVIGHESARAMQHAEWRVFTRECDVIEVYEPGHHRYGAGSGRTVAGMDDATRQIVGQLQKDIERLIAAQNRNVWQPGLRRGRLNGAALHRLAAEDDRIFRRKEVHKAKNTAVSLVVDCSGSMCGRNKMTTAMISAYALSQTLERVNVPHEVIGFTTVRNYIPNMLKGIDEEWNALYEQTGRHWSRWEPLLMPIFKQFQERLTPNVKERFAHAATTRSTFQSQNVDGESVEIAGQRLAQRSEPRKIMFVLSDGQPAYVGGDPTGEGYAHLRQTIDWLERQGIEVVGIGIQSDAVERFYKKCAVINDVTELPAAVMGKLKDALLR